MVGYEWIFYYGLSYVFCGDRFEIIWYIMKYVIFINFGIVKLGFIYDNSGEYDRWIMYYLSW